MSIGYGSRPRLRSRLTQSRSALLWKPWIFGRKDSHLSLATHSGILSSRPSTAPYRYSFVEPSMLLYQSAVTTSASNPIRGSCSAFHRSCVWSSCFAATPSANSSAFASKLAKASSFAALLPQVVTSDSQASVSCFSPGHFRRRTSRPVSYYALFECVAASEPTS